MYCFLQDNHISQDKKINPAPKYISVGRKKRTNVRKEILVVNYMLDKS